MKRILRKAVEIASPLLYRRFFSKTKAFEWGDSGKTPVSITFDVEYERDAKALRQTVQLLDSYGIKGSFACIGMLVEQFPREHSLLSESGHEIVNHTYSHPNHDILNPRAFFNSLSPELQEKEIAGFEETSEKILGVIPKGFRAPHFGDLNSQSAYEILEKRGYIYSSSTVLTKTKSGGMPFFPSRKNFLHPAEGVDAFKIVELPVMTCPEHFYSVFDSFHSFRTSPPAHSAAEFQRLFEKSVSTALQRGIPATFYFDPSDVAGLREFEACLEFLSQEKNALVASSLEVANVFDSKSVKAI